MPTARSARAPQPDRSPRAPRRPRAVAAPRRGAVIRWDRLGRTALLCVFSGVLLLYVHPLLSMWSTRGEAARRHGDVVRLATQKRVLQRRERALRDPRALEFAARRLGMVRTGEKAYVVTGLPAGPGTSASR